MSTSTTGQHVPDHHESNMSNCECPCQKKHLSTSSSVNLIDMLSFNSTQWLQIQPLTNQPLEDMHKKNTTNHKRRSPVTASTYAGS